MAGYWMNTEDGPVHRMYSHPFVVRAVPKKRGYWDRPEHLTITAFRTQEEAEAWLAKWAEQYKTGLNGYESLHIENWNE